MPRACRPATGGRRGERWNKLLLTALSRPPCLLSFSGGRDSSALLAVATDVARRAGLAPPVPATLLFPGSDETNEDEWQRLVLDHLGLDDWLRLEFDEELDAVGPNAQRLLRRHGLIWPFNLHFHLPIIEAAAGGSVITGFAGDELGESCNVVMAERLWAEHAVRRPHDVAALAYRLAPRPPKWPREFLRAGRDIAEMNITWLTRRGELALRAEFASDSLLVPGWDRILRDNFWRSRFFQVCKENFQIVADVHDVRMLHPFVEAPMIQALAGVGGFGGLRGGRAEIMSMLARDLLPPEVLARESKATFTDALWTRTADEFARRWTGGGVDHRFVDGDALVRAWISEPRPVLATTLLQSAWLATEA